MPPGKFNGIVNWDANCDQPPFSIDDEHKKKNNRSTDIRKIKTYLKSSFDDDIFQGMLYIAWT